LVKRNVTVIDPFWGLGFAVMVSGLWLASPPTTWRGALVAAMAWIWGLRYGLHLYWRAWGHTEATTYYPYKQWRDQAGESFWWVSILRVFLPAAIGTSVVGLPILAAMHADQPASLRFSDLFGIVVWLFGLAFEAIADYQLATFKHEPANQGRVMSHGLWAYSRHPNYFGDALLWWGFWIVAAPTPMGFWTVVSPVLMTYLLMRVSGVAMVESRSRIGGSPEYRRYAATTSSFLPAPPRHDAGPSVGGRS
jgi:steroid 5-alpha reductase family enzyme